MKISIVVFWVMTTCSLLGKYQRFGDNCCLHIRDQFITQAFISYLLTDLITYLLTPWSRVLLVKLTCLQLVQKFPAFYGTRRFITAFTSARHLSLSRSSPYPPPTSHFLKIHLKRSPVLCTFSNPPA